MLTCRFLRKVCPIGNRKCACARPKSIERPDKLTSSTPGAQYPYPESLPLMPARNSDEMRLVAESGVEADEDLCHGSTRPGSQKT